MKRVAWRTAFVLLFGMLWSIMAAPAQAQPAEDVPAGLTFKADLAYGAHKSQKLDLYYSTTQKLPLIIFIHGGGWKSGDKSENLARNLLWRGFAMASINYRLLGEATFPANIADCQRAVRWLRLNAGSYNLDTSKIGVIGHSAGGHLAALLGASGGKVKIVGEEIEPVDASVQAVADISGVSDFALIGPSHLISQFFPGPPFERPRQIQFASPITYISPTSAPFLLIHGEKDAIVPVIHQRKMYEALVRNNVRVTLHVLPGEEHNLSSVAWAKVLDLAGDFFERELKTPEVTH